MTFSRRPKAAPDADATKRRPKRTRGADYVAPEPKTKAQRKQGRPSDYEPHMIQLAAVVASTGATDAEIAKELGVSRQTYHRWKQERPDLRESVERAKAAIDDRVEQSLLQRALGGTKRKVVQNAAGEVEQTVTEDVPPSDTAMIFWLKNRRPHQWRDRHETELVVPAAELTSEEIDVRSMALATLALLREAPDAPMIEGVAALVEAQPDRDESTAMPYDPVEAQPADWAPQGTRGEARDLDEEDQAGRGGSLPLDDPE